MTIQMTNTSTWVDNNDDDYHDVSDGDDVIEEYMMLQL